MKSMKRVIPVILSALMCGSFAFAACGHSHTFSEDWTPDGANGHYHAATCGDYDGKDNGWEEHTEANAEGKCGKCGYQLTTPAPAPVVATGITITATADEVEIGGTVTLSATLTPTGATGTVVWSSLDETKATVNASTGVVTGIAAGDVQIKATVGTVTQTKTITVKAAQQAAPALTDINISGGTSVVKGQTLQLSAAKVPATAEGTVEWSSDKTNIATVDASGLVTGVGEGTATITAKIGSVEKTVDITVTEAQQSAASTPLPAGNKIYVVGDSTVCEFTDIMYLPRYGYGTQLHEYLNVQKSQVQNLALSGRSSKDYLGRSEYTTLKNNISAGDYLIIGFGHNDEKNDDATRFTNPVGDRNTEGSFQKSLYDNYVKLAVDKGATPILCTPIVRYDSSGLYTGAKVHNTSDGDYAAAIRALGEDTGTTVIDLTTITMTLNKNDNDAAQYFYSHGTYVGDPVEGGVTGSETPSGRDDTHINEYGAKMVAYQFANALKATNCALKANVRDNITAPTKEVDYIAAVTHANFVKKPYSPFDPSTYNSTKWSISADGWYGTVMGEHGGNSIDSSYKVQEDGGKFTVGINKKKGKIGSTSDGFAAAFMQVAKNKDFKITVTAKLTTVTASDDGPDQAAFGLMLRDDIYVNIPAQDKSLSSNYVAAGAFADGTSAIFKRKDGKLVKSSRNAVISTTATYTLSIEKKNQAITATFSDGTNSYTVGSEEFLDFNLFAMDSDYMYICLFATRGLTAEFTNVIFEDMGENSGA